jgi:hypothetical protein
VMFPSTFHAHHDLDDDLEGEGVNVSGGHNSFGLTVSSVQIFPPEEVSGGYTFESVGQKYVLTDGTRVMEVYNVQGLAHAQGMLIAYLPKEKMVIEAGLFTPPAPNAPPPATVTPSHRSFYNNVQRPAGRPPSAIQRTSSPLAIETDRNRPGRTPVPASRTWR